MRLGEHENAFMKIPLIRPKVVSSLKWALWKVPPSSQPRPAIGLPGHLNSEHRCQSLGSLRIGYSK